MIPIELLKQVKTIVTHADCPDGLASAMILHDALPEAEVVFAQHGKPSLLELQATPGLLFCDITPTPERADEFVAAGAIVLDHHIDKEAVVAKFGERGVFAHETREPGVSGAMLAFREVWNVVRHQRHPESEAAVFQRAAVEDFARLAGIRDTWQKSHPRWREALVAYHALTLHDWEHWRTRPPYLTADDLAVGEALLKKRERDVEQCAGNAWIGPVSVERVRTTTFQRDGASVLRDEHIEVARIALAIVNAPYELASDVSDLLREKHKVESDPSVQVRNKRRGSGPARLGAFGSAVRRTGARREVRWRWAHTRGGVRAAARRLLHRPVHEADAGRARDAAAGGAAVNVPKPIERAALGLLGKALDLGVLVLGEREIERLLFTALDLPPKLPDETHEQWRRRTGL